MPAKSPEFSSLGWRLELRCNVSNEVLPGRSKRRAEWHVRRCSGIAWNGVPTLVVQVFELPQNVHVLSATGFEVVPGPSLFCNPFRSSLATP